MENAFSDRITDVPKSFIREILKVTIDDSIISFAGGLPRLVLLAGMTCFFVVAALMRMRRGRPTPTNHSRRSP